MQTLTCLDCIQTELSQVENYLKSVALSPIGLVTRTVNYSLSAPGKRLRPALVILVSKALGYSGSRLVPCASAVEMTHAATLVHDDIVDEAKLRRGKDSANHKFGNEVSVLSGDFLFARAFQIMAKLEDSKLLETLSDIAIGMCEGEMFHITKKGDPYLTEEEYFEIIRRKTANFISACCEIGCKLGRADEIQHRGFANYGLYLGMAFQIIDDILNLVGDESVTGKPKGSDLLAGKYSLPVIRLIQNSQFKIRPNQTEVEEIISLCHKNQTFDYAKAAARQYVENARQEISFLPASIEKQALYRLADYIIERES